jgi:hypothetical protein
MKRYAKKVEVRGNEYVFCHHCGAPIGRGSFRYIYGKDSFCQKCSGDIDTLITRIAKW